MVVGARLRQDRLVHRFRILELQQRMAGRAIAHAIRQPRPLRRAPCLSLTPHEKNIRFGRLAQEIYLDVHADLHRRQGQLQEGAEELMGLGEGRFPGHTYKRYSISVTMSKKGKSAGRISCIVKQSDRKRPPAATGLASVFLATH